MKIEQIKDDEKKKEITRAVLEALPEWFGIPEAREEYIEKSAGRLFWCAYEDGQAVGFLYLNETGKATAELYVMGILKAYQRKGIGRLLFDAAKETARRTDFAPALCPKARIFPCLFAQRPLPTMMIAT